MLREKPLTGPVAETEQVLAVARDTGTPLWEAFAFPFHDQMARLRPLPAEGASGELREIQSGFHFFMSDRDTNAVVRGEEEPRLLAGDTSLGSGLALQDLATAAARLLRPREGQGYRQEVGRGAARPG